MTQKKKEKKNKKIHTAVGLVVFFLAIFFFSTSNIFQTVYEDGAGFIENEVLADTEERVVEIADHLPIPDSVKTIYMSSCVVGTPSFRSDLVKLVEETELNSIIIDIKDYTGTLSYVTDNPLLSESNGTGCGTADMKEFIEELHSKGIFVIGRITVFQDPFYTKLHPESAVKKASDGSVWEDYKGLSFVEVGARDYWEYIVEISKESYALGFDELNYDYVRFPSDGNMKDIAYPYSQAKVDDPKIGKSGVLEEFFKYLDGELRPDPLNDDRLITSADLFGMTTTNTDDLNIGQVLEKALPYFDYIAPMVYPSHYPPGFNGWADPNDYPYEVVEFSMTEAARRAEVMRTSTTTPENIRQIVSSDQLRSWIQDFDYGGYYGPEEVRAQIQATYDSGLDSWMIWAPSNRYTRGALLD